MRIDAVNSFLSSSPISYVERPPVARVTRDGEAIHPLPQGAQTPKRLIHSYDTYGRAVARPKPVEYQVTISARESDALSRHIQIERNRTSYVMMCLPALLRV